MTEVSVTELHLQLPHEPEVLASGTRARRLPPVLSSLPARMSRPFAALRGVPHVLTWTGVVLAAVGFVLVAVAWGKVAGLTNVGLQMPYVISAGATGLGLVAVGVAVVSVAAKRADAAERSQQLRELRDVLADVRRALEERP